MQYTDSTIQTRTSENPAWFEEWFDSTMYSELYSHRSENEARGAVELLDTTLRLAPGSRVLDLCCGAGRHTRALGARGYNVTGIDLSKTLLGIAKEETQLDNVAYYNCDMREAYPDPPYDCIANFFTSFGYFEDRRDDQRVLGRIAEALRTPGGYFFFDYLNPEYTRETLKPDDVKVLRGMRVTQRRRIEDDWVRKSITISDPEKGTYEFTEQVRLYTHADFERMFADVGLVIQHTFGDYTGAEFTTRSPRQIIVAQVQ